MTRTCIARPGLYVDIIALGAIRLLRTCTWYARVWDTGSPCAIRLQAPSSGPSSQFLDAYTQPGIISRVRKLPNVLLVYYKITFYTTENSCSTINTLILFYSCTSAVVCDTWYIHIIRINVYTCTLLLYTATARLSTSSRMDDCDMYRIGLV